VQVGISALLVDQVVHTMQVAVQQECTQVVLRFLFVIFARLEDIMGRQVNQAAKIVKLENTTVRQVN
jgi:hypothetical protein